MGLSHDEIMARTDEMFKILEVMTEYTEKYGRPSLSDIAAFETMLSAFKEVEEWYPEEKQINCDIYRAWADYLEHDQFFTLEYGWEHQEEQVNNFLYAKGIISELEDCENCGFPITDIHECEEGEEEDAEV